MTLEQTNVVDIIGIDKPTGHVRLTITDAHDWTDSYDHLLLLQEKLNTYLAFIESGEIYSEYPYSIGKEVDIEIVFKEEVSNTGIEFLRIASNVIEQSGFGFCWKVRCEN